MSTINKIASIEATCDNPDMKDKVVYYIVDGTDKKQGYTLLKLSISQTKEETTMWALAMDMKNVSYTSLFNKKGKKTLLDTAFAKQLDGIQERAKKSGLTSRASNRTCEPGEHVCTKALEGLDAIREERRKVDPPLAFLTKYNVVLKNVNVRPDNRHAQSAIIVLPSKDMKMMAITLPSTGIDYGSQTTVLLDRNRKYHVWGYTHDGVRSAFDIEADNLVDLVKENAAC